MRQKDGGGERSARVKSEGGWVVTAEPVDTRAEPRVVQDATRHNLCRLCCVCNDTRAATLPLSPLPFSPPLLLLPSTPAFSPFSPVYRKEGGKRELARSKVF